jgi:hypothetical protein
MAIIRGRFQGTLWGFLFGIGAKGRLYEAADCGRNTAGCKDGLGRQ